MFSSAKSDDSKNTCAQEVEACEAYYMGKSIVPANCFALGRDSAQDCTFKKMLDFIPVKRKSHLRVKPKEILNFFSFFPSIFGNERKIKETF